MKLLPPCPPRLLDLFGHTRGSWTILQNAARPTKGNHRVVDEQSIPEAIRILCRWLEDPPISVVKILQLDADCLA